MNKHVSQGLLAAMVLSLVACGGSSGGSKKSPTSSSATSSLTSSAPVSSAPPTSSSADTSSASSSSPALTGVFLDNVVAGIGYRTATEQGMTSPLGEYNYRAGESVVFFIGDLELPPVPASGVVTPADIANAAHSNTTEAEVTKTNILQLLQTLDNDGDPANGIQITAETNDLFTGDNLPDVTSVEFDNEVVALLPEGKALVNESDALAHFDSALQAQLLGSWVFSEGPGQRNVLTFIDATRYLIIHEHDDNETQRAGSVEFGTYEWNVAAKTLKVRMVGQSDVNGGLWESESAEAGVVTHTFDVSGGQLVLGTPRDGQATFTRVIDSSNPYIGGWTMTEHEDNNLNVLTFLSASEYVIAHTNNQESYTNAPNQPLSGEFGTYTLTNNRFLVTGASVDTDGEGGLYNREDPSDQANETLTITPWGDLLFADDDEGTFSFVRVGSFAAKLQDMNEEGALGIINAVRDPSGFNANELPGKTWIAHVVHAEDSSGSFEFTFDELNSEGVGSGALVVHEADEETESFSVSWHINSTSAVVLTVHDGEEVITLTLAKLVGSNSNNAFKILLSIESGEESSLWETTLNALVE